MTHDDLMIFFGSRGLLPEQFWIGSEHPALESRALELLRPRRSKAVLEIGYQAGGFAVPVIRELHSEEGFTYLGVDNLSYGNSVSGELLRDFLLSQGVDERSFRFAVGDAGPFLVSCARKGLRFDLIMVDHVKTLYPQALALILSLDLLTGNGMVLLHDVLSKAAVPWTKCRKICSLLGYPWEIQNDVPDGLAVVRNTQRSGIRRALGRVVALTSLLTTRLRRGGHTS